MLSYSQKCFSYKFFLKNIVQQLLPFQEIVQLRHVHYISLAKGFFILFYGDLTRRITKLFSNCDLFLYGNI